MESKKNLSEQCSLRINKLKPLVGSSSETNPGHIANDERLHLLLDTTICITFSWGRKQIVC